MEVILVKAFTRDKNRGNPAGVVFNDDTLSEKQMTEISAMMEFSESAFVSQSNIADFKIRFFTPTQEVDLCGHATIASVHVLIKNRKIKINDLATEKISIETKSGILPVECRKDGLIVMTQHKPQFSDNYHDKKKISELLNISIQEILDHPIQIVSTGTPKLIAAVNSLDTLFKIRPDFEGIKKYCQKYSVKGFYPFTFETIEKESDFHARQFNPLAGINEDPITGVAGGALGAYIVKHKILKKNNFVIEQGYCMNKGGKVYVNIDDGVKVGGYAVIFGEKNVQIKA